MFHEVKKIQGTYKGNIGENLFASTRRKIILTQMYDNSFIKYYLSNLSQDMYDFLYLNWKSIDAIEINNPLTIYEIKTRNYYGKNFNYRKSKANLKEIKMLEEAKSLGFKVKTITVWFGKQWFFWIKEKDFEKDDFYISDLANRVR